MQQPNAVPNIDSLNIYHADGASLGVSKENLGVSPSAVLLQFSVVVRLCDGLDGM